MSRLRDVVASHYNFSERTDMRPFISAMLENDNFTCEDYTKVIQQDM
jgi:hypothetical protein